MNWAELSDGQLAAALSSGADEAIEELIRRHAGMVYRTCRRITASHDDAEDATQAVFATLAEKAEHLSSYPSLGGWLYSVAWHVSRRLHRSQEARREHERRAGSSPAMAHRVEQDNELVQELYRAIEMLPPDYRMAIVLHHLEGLSVRDLAQLTDCSQGTAASRLSRARAMLRERLSWRGMVMAEGCLLSVLAAELSSAPARPPFAINSGTISTTSAERGAVAAWAGAPMAVAPMGMGGTMGAGTATAAGTLGALFSTKWIAAACVGATVTTGVTMKTLDLSATSIIRFENGSAAESRTIQSKGKDWPLTPDAYRTPRSRSNSSSVVPEPASLSLLAVAATLLRRNRRR